MAGIKSFHTTANKDVFYRRISAVKRQTVTIRRLVSLRGSLSEFYNRFEQQVLLSTFHTGAFVVDDFDALVIVIIPTIQCR